MEIKLAKFGSTLVFRDRGREAFAAFEPSLKHYSTSDDLVIDFEGVLTFTPSWGDEFLSPLFERYGRKLVLKNTTNSSVKATLKILNETKKFDFNVAS